MQLFVLSQSWDGPGAAETLGVFSTLEKAQNTGHHDDQFQRWQQVSDGKSTYWRADEKYAGECVLFIEERTLDELIVPPVADQPQLQLIRTNG